MKSLNSILSRKTRTINYTQHLDYNHGILANDRIYSSLVQWRLLFWVLITCCRSGLLLSSYFACIWNRKSFIECPYSGYAPRTNCVLSFQSTFSSNLAVRWVWEEWENALCSYYVKLPYQYLHYIINVIYYYVTALQH